MHETTLPLPTAEGAAPVRLAGVRVSGTLLTCLAVAAANAALLAAIVVVESVTGSTLPLVMVLGVALAAWYCPRRFTVVLTVVITALFPWALFTPRWQYPIDTSPDLVREIAFIIMAAITVVAVWAAREAADRVRALLGERNAIISDLERANRAKDDFLSHVSHELRTPMTTIGGNASVLRRSHSQLGEADVLDALADIEAGAARMNGIIDDLLVLARLEQNQHVDTEPAILAREVQRIVDEHTRRYPHRDVRVQSMGDPRPVLLHSAYVGQVMRNLLSNAEKYSPPQEPIDVRIERDDEEVRVFVRDHGDGIPDGEGTAIFDPFFRSESTSGVAPGIGIGLAVCKRLVEAQRGHMWAGNHDGGGAEFGFALPVEHALDSARDGDPGPAQGAARDRAAESPPA